MASTTSAFAYIQARLQARHGDRPEPERWRLLESTTDLGGYLQHARGTALAPWVQHFTADAGAHHIEQSLRHHWRAYSTEISAWAPSEWRPAIRWIGSLPDLPGISHLALGGSVRPWMLADPVLAPLAMEDFQQRREAIASSDFARVAHAIQRGQPPVNAWLEDWRARTPAGQQRIALDDFHQVFARHIANILEDPASRPAGPALREHLLVRLNSLFRRHAGQVGAVFAHLGLMAVDMERLRGGLVMRSLFPQAGERPRWA